MANDAATNDAATNDALSNDEKEVMSKVCDAWRPVRTIASQLGFSTKRTLKALQSLWFQHKVMQVDSTRWSSAKPLRVHYTSILSHAFGKFHRHFSKPFTVGQFCLWAALGARILHNLCVIGHVVKSLSKDGTCMYTVVVPATAAAAEAPATPVTIDTPVTTDLQRVLNHLSPHQFTELDNLATQLEWSEAKTKRFLVTAWLQHRAQHINGYMWILPPIDNEVETPPADAVASLRYLPRRFVEGQLTTNMCFNKGFHDPSMSYFLYAMSAAGHLRKVYSEDRGFEYERVDRPINVEYSVVAATDNVNDDDVMNDVNDVNDVATAGVAATSVSTPPAPTMLDKIKSSITACLSTNSPNKETNDVVTMRMMHHDDDGGVEVDGGGGGAWATDILETVAAQCLPQTLSSEPQCMSDLHVDTSWTTETTNDVSTPPPLDVEVPQTNPQTTAPASLTEQGAVTTKNASRTKHDISDRPVLMRIAFNTVVRELQMMHHHQRAFRKAWRRRQRREARIGPAPFPRATPTLVIEQPEMETTNALTVTGTYAEIPARRFGGVTPTYIPYYIRPFVYGGKVISDYTERLRHDVQTLVRAINTLINMLVIEQPRAATHMDWDAARSLLALMGVPHRCGGAVGVVMRGGCAPAVTIPCVQSVRATLQKLADYLSVMLSDPRTNAAAAAQEILLHELQLSRVE